MSLINCIECNSEISDKAKTCPKCGCPISHKKKNKIIAKPFLILIFFILFLILIYTYFSFFKKVSTTDLEKISESIVTLYVYDNNGNHISTGSGFIAYNDKTIVTNFHVIQNGYKIEAKAKNNNIFNIDYVSFYNYDNDIAILKTQEKTGLKVLKISKTDNLKVGDKIYAIGCPLGLDVTVSDGIVSAINNNTPIKNIQITAPTSSGSSGGALINEYGKVIGITYASYADGQNLNLAIPSEDFIQKIKSSETYSISYLAQLYNPLGNTLENFSTSDCQLVEYNDFFFESYNSKNEIIKHSSDTTTSLNINGTFLNIYHEKLYYISSKNNKHIGCYDLNTNENIENILNNYPINIDFTSITKLFVTDNGISIVLQNIDYDKRIFERNILLHLDFNGNIIKLLRLEEYTDGDYIETLLNKDTLLIRNPETWCITALSLIDFNTTTIQLDFQPQSIYTLSNSNKIYIIDSTITDDYSSLIEYDIITGNTKKIHRNNATNFTMYTHNNSIYYTSSEGTSTININSNNYETIASDYCLNNIIIHNNILYGITSDKSMLDAVSDDTWEYNEFFITIDLKNKQLKVLETKHHNLLEELSEN